MEWSKMKNMILAILVITNLFLLYFVVRDEARDHRFRVEARSNAISFLEEKGVRVSEEQVPQRASLFSQTVERDLESESALAAALLKDTVRMEARGSEVYRYQNASGWVQFHSDGSFSAEFGPGVFPVGTDREQACLDVLALMEFQGELLNEEDGALTFRQIWEGSPLFTQQVTLVCENGSVTAMTGGRRLVGKPVKDSAQEPISAATALIGFYNGLNTLGDVCSEISAIQEGYVGTAALSGPMTLVPVWHIATDTGTYQMNMLTGVLTRAS